MNVNVKKATNLLKIIGLGVFAYILSTLDYLQLFSILKTIELLPFAIYCLAFYGFFFTQTFRWHVIQEHLSRPIGFQHNLSLSIESLFLRYVTPGRLGDTIKVLFLNERYAIEKKTGLLIFFFDRLQDLFYMSILALLGLYFYVPSQSSMAIYLFCAAIIVVFLFKNKLITFLLKMLNVKTQISTSVRFEAYLLAINVLCFSFYFAQAYFLARSFGMNMPILKIGTIAAMAAIISLIPISISGLGVREGVFIFFLAQFGWTKEQAVLFSLLDNIFMPVFFILSLELLNRVLIMPKIKKSG